MNIDQNELKKEYSSKYDEYKRLCFNVRAELKKILKDNDIDFLSVTCRIKSFESFYDKIKRKNYEDHWNDIMDICGLRIICYYPSQIEPITQILEDEFEVIDSENKTLALKPDEFGYSSSHFIVKLKDTWSVPSFRGLYHLKFEIQLRTILMHAWADISHKLAYKKKEYVPDHLIRRLNRLSALLELGDEQFDFLIDKKEEYIEKVSESIKDGEFDINQEFNIDTLQKFLDLHFPDREKNIDDTSTLLDEITIYNNNGTEKISFKTLSDAYNDCKDSLDIEDYSHLYDITNCEAEEVKQENPEKFKEQLKEKYFTQLGACRLILTCKINDYKEFIIPPKIEELNINEFED